MVTALFGVDASDEDESCSEENESNTTLLFRFLFLFLVGVGCPGPVVRMFCKKVGRSPSRTRVPDNRHTKATLHATPQPWLSTPYAD
jgi:hypothetical protein